MTRSPTDPGPNGGPRDIPAMVLLAAELVPRGRVVSYGDLAALVGCSPRQVGRIMALHGGETHWWRVVNHAGELPPHLLTRAVEHWQREGIRMKDTGRGVQIAHHRADLASLADAWEARGSATE